MYHGSPDMTLYINIFKYWKKRKLFRKMFEKFSMSSFQASFDPFFPQKNYFLPKTPQNTPKHAYYQKLEENKTLMKKKFWGFFCSFFALFCPKSGRKSNFSKIRRCYALSEHKIELSSKFHQNQSRQSWDIAVTNGRTDGRTDGRKDGRTDTRTDLIL